MKFLQNYTIDCDKLRKYTELNKTFYEDIDLKLAKLILECSSNQIAEESKQLFKTFISKIKNNRIAVLLKNRYGLGRFYGETTEKYCGNLIILPRIIKNTIFKYHEYVDIDQVKGHPSILVNLAFFNGKHLPNISKYVDSFDSIYPEFIEYYSADPDNPLTKDDVKYLFNITIYGGGFKTWIANLEKGCLEKNYPPKTLKNTDITIEFYDEFRKEVNQMKDLIYENNPQIITKVCVGKNLQEFEKKNKVISFFLQTIEHEITFHAYKYLCNENKINPRVVDWGYDGLTFPLREATDIDAMVNDINKYIQEKTGFALVKFKHKPFDEEEILHEVLEKRNNVREDDEVKIPDAIWNKDDWEREWCKLCHQGVYARKYLNSQDETVMEIKDQSTLFKSYRHLSYKIEKKTQYYINDWMDDPDILRYDNMDCYPPPLQCPDNIFNTWMPFRFQNKQELEYDPEPVAIFEQYLKNLTNHDDHAYQTLLNFHAHLFQRPAEKMNIFPVLISNQGCGKSTLFNIMTEIMGQSRVLETRAPEEDIFGKHNPLMMNAYYVILSETNRKNIQGYEGKLKGLITDTNGLNINPKGVNPFKIKCYARFILGTNSLDPVQTSADDRRTFIIRCNDSLANNTEYFKTINKELFTPTALFSIYKYLSEHVDISNWNFRETPLHRTEFHQEIVEVYESPIKQWLRDFLNEYKNEDDVIEFTGKQLYTSYMNFRAGNGYTQERFNVTTSSLMLKLSHEFKIPKEMMEIKKTKLGNNRIFKIKEIIQFLGFDQDETIVETP